ncbi:hypothetical protein GQR58_030080 [Nymphon striatum]|nr:hypothetical protein GQR58_030080 [Nymphon striatum]
MRETQSSETHSRSSYTSGFRRSRTAQSSQSCDGDEQHAENDQPSGSDVAAEDDSVGSGDCKQHAVSFVRPDSELWSGPIEYGIDGPGRLAVANRNRGRRRQPQTPDAVATATDQPCAVDAVPDSSDADEPTQRFESERTPPRRMDSVDDAMEEAMTK